MQEHQVFYFQIGEIQLSLGVDKTQLSLAVGEIQLSLRVNDQHSFISAAPTQNSVKWMENASKLFNCELNKAKHFKNPKAYAPLYLSDFQFNFHEEEENK